MLLAFVHFLHFLGSNSDSDIHDTVDTDYGYKYGLVNSSFDNGDRELFAWFKAWEGPRIAPSPRPSFVASWDGFKR